MANTKQTPYSALDKAAVYAKRLIAFVLGKGSPNLARAFEAIDFFYHLDISELDKMFFFAMVEMFVVQIYFLSRLPTDVKNQARAKKVFLEFFSFALDYYCSMNKLPLPRVLTLPYITGSYERQDVMAQLGLQYDTAQPAKSLPGELFQQLFDEALTYGLFFTQPQELLANGEGLLENGLPYYCPARQNPPAFFREVHSTVKELLDQMEREKDQILPQARASSSSSSSSSSESSSCDSSAVSEGDDEVFEVAVFPPPGQELPSTSAPTPQSRPLSDKRRLPDDPTASADQPVAKKQATMPGFLSNRLLYAEDINTMLDKCGQSVPEPVSLESAKDLSDKAFQLVSKVDGLLKYTAKVNPNLAPTVTALQKQWHGFSAAFEKVTTNIIYLTHNLDKIQKGFQGSDCTNIYLYVSSAFGKAGWFELLHGQCTKTFAALRGMLGVMSDCVGEGVKFEWEFPADFNPEIVDFFGDLGAALKVALKAPPGKPHSPESTCASVDNFFNEIQESLAAEVESFEQRGSDWVLRSIDFADLYTAAYIPIRGSTYSPLPSYIQKKHAIVNVKNTDNRCFLWSILAALHPAKKNAERISKYLPFANSLNLDGISFPVQIDAIDTFSSLNHISVNVFACDTKSVYPIHRCDRRLERHVNLMYHNGHYSFIRNFDKLMYDQTRHKAKGFYCDMCLFPMYSQERLDSHSCHSDTLANLQMPREEEKWLKFKNFHKMLRKPRVVYADFEAILNPFKGCEPPPAQEPLTEKYQEHVPCSFGMVEARSCCSEPKFENLHVETCEDPASAFLDRLVKIAQDNCRTDNKFPLSMTTEDEHKFQAAETCRVCQESLGTDRVRDHCHICGKFRSALHSSCNQMLRLDREIVVVMHNMRRYDTHIIIRSLGAACVRHKLKLNCVPKGMENYVTFSIDGGAPDRRWKIRFVDSVQFLAASLEKLVQQVPTELLKAMETFFHKDLVSFLGRKGVFPYDYLDSWDKLKVLHPIPKANFFNKLNGEHISDSDYQHYLDVCSTTGVTNLQKYMEMYLSMDVLQLADVFEQLRKFSMDNYELDPCHYSTLPGLAWDACLKKTGVKLELLTDYDMYRFFEQGIKGGISVISKRAAEANNRYMADWNSALMQSFIMYLDKNNLYGWSMGEKQPTSGFRYLTQDEIDELVVRYMDPNGPIGYVLEVDLDYPPSLHDKHNDYPLAPERLEITEDMLSSYSKDVAQSHGLKLKPVKKLAPNLHNKKNYIVHLSCLQYYLEQGLILRKIHKVLCFNQESWIRPYIDFNTEMRKAAKTELDKNLYKFFVNAFFGKTMENVRKYLTVELVTDEKRLLKIVKKPLFKRATIFTDNLVACSVGRSTISLNKPIYVGFCVLELSKLLMFRFHYDYMVPKYGKSLNLLMTDTDSLCYHIVTENDVYRDMLEHMDMFDFSDYPQTHFLHSSENKKVVGKMKDELNGKPGIKFCGLRPKMYSLLTEDNVIKRAKGVE